MKVIRFIQSGEIVQLGIDKKTLFIKWGNVPSPMKLGELKDIRSMSIQRGITVGDKTIKVPRIIKEMSKNITPAGIKMADNFSDEEFYNDFLEDYKQMSSEGTLIFIGEFKEWA